VSFLVQFIKTTKPMTTNDLIVNNIDMIKNIGKSEIINEADLPIFSKTIANVY